MIAHTSNTLMNYSQFGLMTHYEPDIGRKITQSLIDLISRYLLVANEFTKLEPSTTPHNNYPNNVQFINILHFFSSFSIEVFWFIIILFEFEFSKVLK